MLLQLLLDLIAANKQVDKRLLSFWDCQRRSTSYNNNVGNETIYSSDNTRKIEKYTGDFLK
jgi:hypothetical protein